MEKTLTRWPVFVDHFKRCNGCKLQSECMVKPEEMFPVMEDGKYVDKWAIRTTAMIARELGKQNNKAA
ncbi:restriction endonuclease [Escherichia coli]|nr:restriction endonuclease [Escherichia coli]